MYGVCTGVKSTRALDQFLRRDGAGGSRRFARIGAIPGAARIAGPGRVHCERKKVKCVINYLGRDAHTAGLIAHLAAFLVCGLLIGNVGMRLRARLGVATK
jgi:hypothetical protein